MRTKALCAAALAAGALTSMAQVYSANVVGYVNVAVAGGGSYNLIANPLDATMGGTVAGGNNIANVFGTAAQPGDQILRWNVGNFDFDGTIMTKGPTAWDSTFDLKPGEAVFYINNGNNINITFVGQVNQGAWTYPGALGGTPGKVLGSGSYNAIGGPVPLGGSFTNALLGLAVQPGDQVLTWNVGNFDFDGTINTKGPAAWDNPQVQLAPGIGLYYVNNGGDLTWTSNFTVQ